MENKYVNYGDVDPLECSRYVRKKSENEFEVFYGERTFDVDKEGNPLYYCAFLTVNPNDSWIEKESVGEVFGCDYDDCSPEEQVVMLVDYYSIDNFSPNCIGTRSKPFVSESKLMEIYEKEIKPNLEV